MLRKLLGTSPAIIGLGASAALASPAGAACVTMDLRTGHHGPPVAGISYVSPPTLVGGWYQAVLRLDFSSSRKLARFAISYPAAPTGFTVDIGDSSTNDAGGGDAGTQSNDAEAVITGALSADVGYPAQTLNVHGRDGVPLEVNQLAGVYGLARKGETVRIDVAHHLIRFDGALRSGELNSPWLYQLHGNPDTEGPVNDTIYASFNRVIGGDFRGGTGVGMVKACF
jgi:hypothetical protein